MVDASSLRTLVFITDQERILLGLKKTGFGSGKWNGFGGKVEAGETIEQAASRELQEEAGILATGLGRCGILSFVFGNGLAPLSVHVFRAGEWIGEVRESSEMAPRWFSWADIPYGQMWIDDQYWLPLVLKSQYFIGSFHLVDTETLSSWEVKEVAAEELLRHV